MTACIRLFCASALIAFVGLWSDEPLVKLHADNQVQYESLLTLISEYNFKSAPINTETQQTLKAVLSLAPNGKKESLSKFPVPMKMVLEDVSFRSQVGQVETTFDPTNPKTALEIAEMRHWIGHPFYFTVTDTEPPLSFAEEVEIRYGGLKTIHARYFDALLGDDLHTLFSIVSRPLKTGESFQIVKDKNERRLYREVDTYTVQEITPEHVVLSSKALIERQKIFLEPAKDYEERKQTVIYGDLQGTWKIHRANGLLFSFQEKGVLQYGIKEGDKTVTIKHMIEKQIATSPQEES